MLLQAKRVLPFALFSVLLAGCASDNIQDIEAGYDQEAGAGPMAMAHVNHVAKSWMETPRQVGLLTIARSEATVASTHADLAVQRSGDSDWVKMHAVHVKHALEPKGKGPGKGYGLIKAVKEVKQHIKLAIASEDTSDAVAFHGEQIMMSADSVLARIETLDALANQIIEAPRGTDFTLQAEEMSDLTSKILLGDDINGDGNINWEENEAGLDQALSYLEYLQEKEAAYHE